MMHRTSTALGLLVVVLGVIAVACGGGGGHGTDLESDFPTTVPLPDGTGQSTTGSGGGGSGGGGSPSLTFRVLISGDFALTPTAAFPVARSQAELDALNQQYLPPILTFAPTTPIDFTKEIVVGVFLGNRPTAGYTAAVTAVAPNGDGATVNWEERQPAPGTVGATVITSPFVLIAMTKVTGPIDFSGSVK